MIEPNLQFDPHIGDRVRTNDGRYGEIISIAIGNECCVLFEANHQWFKPDQLTLIKNTENNYEQNETETS